MPINHGKYKGEAEVTDIIERRAAQQIVGTVEKIGPKETRLRVDSRAFDSHVDIPAAQALGAKEGEKVVARLTDWPIHSDSPVGEVIEILGQSGENNTEMHAILAEFGLPTRYPEELEKIADAIDEKITDEEIARREDFRQVTTFTIDPADAKDFDDALSLRRTPEGEWEVGVHIADVTHYVREEAPSTAKPTSGARRYTWSTAPYPCCPSGCATTSAPCGRRKRSSASRSSSPSTRMPT